MRLMILFLALTSILSPLYSSKQSYNRELLEMSLQELMEIEVESGTITGVSRSNLPVAITVISREDILCTPARNIYDLIAVYVPGATYVSHFQGLRLGIRGQLSDQNYSYQLMVNGKNVNFNAYYGMMLEMQNKDLNEIERIEIVRGPGSVTYGPGATAGTINIITKKPEINFVDIGDEQNIQYRFTNKSFEMSYSRKDLACYLYGSMCNSEGLEDTGFWYIDRAHGYGWGYMDPDWGNYGLGTEVPSYLEDYRDTPEIKLQSSIRFRDMLALQLRYNTYNHSYMSQKREVAEGPSAAGHLAKSFTAELTSKNRINNLIWNNSVGYKSISFRQLNFWQLDELPHNHIAQLGNSFSENEVLFKSLIKYDNDDDLRLALALEGGYEYYAPEWGKDDDTFIFSLQAPIRFAVMDSSSGFYQYYGDGVATIIEDEIDAWKYAISGEINWAPYNTFRMLLSTRIDKHELANLAVSPRFTLIKNISDNDLIKFTLQQAVRYPIFSDLYSSEFLHNEQSNPEILKGLELTYQGFQNENLEYIISGYYYDIEQLSWINDYELTDIIGEFKLLGIDVEGYYKFRKWKIGGSYSWVNQLDWDSKVAQTAWISGLDGEEIIIEDNGENRINNMPAHSIKCFGTGKLSKDFTLHLDGRFNWDYQQNVMLDAFEDALDIYGNEETSDTFDSIRNDLEEHGYGQFSFTSNVALIWDLPLSGSDVQIKLYGMNLLAINHIRYVIQFWESGNLRQYPRQCGFIDEPLTVGIDVSVTLQ